MNLNKRITKKQKGFSLIEVILVMMITAIAFTGIYGMYSSTVKYDVESRYEVIAAGLAQEGVEMLRNKRDENVYNEATGIGNSIPTSNCYPEWDTTGSNIGSVSCPTNISNQICFNNYYYNDTSSASGDCDGATKTVFTRSCNKTILTTEEQIKITCEVKWKSFANQDLERSSKAEVYLSDWMSR